MTPALTLVAVLAGDGRSQRPGRDVPAAGQAVRLLPVAVPQRRGGARGEQRRPASGPHLHHQRPARRGGERRTSPARRGGERRTSPARRGGERRVVPDGWRTVCWDV